MYIYDGIIFKSNFPRTRICSFFLFYFFYFFSQRKGSVGTIFIQPIFRSMTVRILYNCHYFPFLCKLKLPVYIHCRENSWGLFSLFQIEKLSLFSPLLFFFLLNIRILIPWSWYGTFHSRIQYLKVIVQNFGYFLNLNLDVNFFSRKDFRLFPADFSFFFIFQKKKSFFRKNDFKRARCRDANRVSYHIAFLPTCEIPPSLQ